jgi:sterol 24-C-methyltransferase
VWCFARLSPPLGMDTTLVLIIVVVLLALYYHKSILSGLNLFWYRFSTSCLALKTVYFLPQATVDSFMQSYELFDQEIVTDSPHDETHIVNYYTVINQLCAIGEVEKMYIPPIIDPNVGIFANQLLFEQKMARDLDIMPNFHVLDIGCGRGRIASHIASSTGARVTGINIDKSQIENAEQYASLKGLSDRLTFRIANYNNPLPFQNEFFDAIYQVQVFTYAKDRDALFKELYRVMVPGAKLSILDWFKLDNYDPSNPHHLDIMNRVKPLIGAVNTISPQEMCMDLEKAGFKIVMNENASINGFQYPLIERADNFFKFLTLMINSLVCLRILPRHFKVLFDRLTKDGEAFVEGDRLGLFTTCHQIVAQKPHKTPSNKWSH